MQVSPSVHNALSTCKYTLLSVEDPSIVPWMYLRGLSAKIMVHCKSGAY